MKSLLGAVVLAVLFLAGCGPATDANRYSIDQARIAAITPNPLPQNDAGTGGDVGCDNARLAMIDYGQLTGSLDAGDREDCYGFRYTVGDILEVSITSSTSLALYPAVDQRDSHGHFIQIPKIAAGVYDLQYAIGRDGVTDGEVTLRILISGSGLGGYTLNLSKQPQNDAGTGQDAAAGATSVTLAPGTYAGFVGNGDLCDEYFYNPLTPGSTLTVTLRPDPILDASLRWYTGYGSSVGVAGLDLNGEANQLGPGGVETHAFPSGLARSSFLVCAEAGTAGQYSIQMAGQ